MEESGQQQVLAEAKVKVNFSGFVFQNGWNVIYI